MLHIFQGTDLDQLVRHMLAGMEADSPANPLQPEVFVVQNHHMGRWLSLRMAERTGIAANLQFEFPAERIWAISRVLYPGIPKMLPSDRGPLTWELMHLLESDRNPLLKPLRNYLEADDRERMMVRNWKLSRRVADIFDQYLVYRPEMLLEWEAGNENRDYPNVSWQAWLWRTLNSRWKSRLGDQPWLHRAKLHERLERAIEGGEIDTDRLPDRFTVFGISSMPPPVARLLVRCASFCDVTFYLPDPQGSGDHPLAASWGTVGGEYREWLTELSGDDITILSEGDTSVPRGGGMPAGRAAGDPEPGAQIGLFAEQPSPPGDTLLSRLQQAIRTGKDPGFCTADHSLRIHSCHNPLREVQVLYDRILEALDRDPGLGPDDILVMTPDLESYAPHIHARFGVQEEGDPKIPYAVAGQTGPVPGLGLLLGLARSRFRATDLLDLFDSELFRSAFSLNDRDLNRLEQWIGKTGIHWGIDRQFRKEMGLPETDSHTWQAGLDRLMLGYAMQPEGVRLFDGIHPVEGIEGTEDLLLLGTFSAVLHRLFECREFCRTPHPVPEWKTFLKRQLEFFYRDGERWRRERTRLQSAVEKLGRESVLAGFERPVEAGIVQEWLEEELDRQPSGRSSGGILFSEMVPVRNIPCRMICMIGMNDGDFPRSKPAVEFDLMQSAPRPGDRSRREDDRLLMLESLFAAKDLLHLSYVGQSDRKGNRFPPSVVVTELIDCLEATCGIPPGDLVVTHPLQPYSRQYFEADRPGPLFSYSGCNHRIAVRMEHEAGDRSPFMEGDPLPALKPEPVSVASLISFYQHPCRALLQNRFGLYLSRMESRIDDREPFSLDRLQEFGMGQELLERYMEGEPAEDYYRLVRADDRLPEGWPGEAAFRKLSRQVSEFGEQLRQSLVHSPEPPVPVAIEAGPHRLTGQIDRIHGGEQILYRFGRQRAKDLVEMWIRHLLVGTAAERGSEPELTGITRMYTRDKKGGVACCEMEPAEEPEAILSALITRYRSGLCNAFPFFPASSHAYAEAVLVRGMTEEAAVEKAAAKWLNERVPYPMEGDDPYNRQVFLHQDPVGSRAFRERAIEFWKPVFKSVK